MSFEQATTKLL